jgi:hypothetical protein
MQITAIIIIVRPSSIAAVIMSISFSSEAVA